MNNFYESFFVHVFCYVLPFLRLHGAEHDACSAEWCHQSSGQQVIRPVGPMDVIAPPYPGLFYGGNGPRPPLPAVHKTKVHAIRTYAEPLFPAPYLIGLLLESGAPRSSCRVLSEYITRRGDANTACTGLPFPRPMPTRDQFDATWKSLTAPLALSPPVECADPPSSDRYWPLRSWAQYVQSRPALCRSIDWTRGLTFVVRGDGYPCAGGSWSQLSVGLLNHGLKARTPAFLWVIGMAVTGDKEMVALGQIWAQVLKVCSLHFRVDKLFIIRAFIIRELPS